MDGIGRADVRRRWPSIDLIITSDQRQEPSQAKPDARRQRIFIQALQAIGCHPNRARFPIKQASQQRGSSTKQVESGRVAYFLDIISLILAVSTSIANGLAMTSMPGPSLSPLATAFSA